MIHRIMAVWVFLGSIALLTQLKAQNLYNPTQGSVQQQYRPIPKAKQLVKVGVGLPLFRQSSVSRASSWKTIGMDVTLERKVGSVLSLIGGLETNYSFSRHAQLYTVELPLGVRYYFSIGRKMKKRADPHSFFSHYITFQTHNVLFSSLFYGTPDPNVERYYRGKFLDHTTNIGKYDEAFNLLQYANLQLGTQFKVSRNHYLDLNAVIPIAALVYHKEELTLSTPAYLTIKYGIVWQK